MKKRIFGKDRVIVNDDEEAIEEEIAKKVKK